MRGALKALSTPIELPFLAASACKSSTGVLPVESVDTPSVFDYYIDTRGSFVCWRDAKTFDKSFGGSGGAGAGKKAESEHMLTLTQHVQKYTHLIEFVLAAEKPLLLIGAPCLAKSSMIEVGRMLPSFSTALLV